MKNQQGPPPPNTPYNRPNKPYVCGRLCEGKPCDFGPLPNGQCSQQENPCKPKWSLRRKRKLITVLSCLVSIAIVAYCVHLSSINPLLFSPGELSHHHAKLIRPSEPGQPAQCSKCHAVNDEKFWFNPEIFDHDHYVNTHACIDCHEQELQPEVADKVDWIKAHGVGDTSPFPESSHKSFEKDLHCIQCHREHRGKFSSITVMTEDKCHSCHSQTFESFNSGHPEFKSYPYRSEKAIYFNHGRKEHATMDCAQCHTYNRLQERHELATFEQACAQCHQSDLIDVDKFRFAVFQLPFKASNNKKPSKVMEYLFPKTKEPKANHLIDYLDKKHQIALFLENVIPNHKELDLNFLQSLFKGCDPVKVKEALGFVDGEMHSYWAALNQKQMSPDMFYSLNFWAQILKDNRSKNIHEDLLNHVNSIKSDKERDVFCFYLMQLYQSPELDRAIMSKKERATLLKIMDSQKSDAVQTLISTLYSKPQIQLSEAEQELVDEFLDIIDGDLDEDEWIQWSMEEFYTNIIVEEEYLELDSIWLGLEDDALEEKLEDLDTDEIMAELLKVKKGRLEAIYKKIRSNFVKEETPIQLSDDDKELVEELQDIVESEYDEPEEWTKFSLSEFFNELLIEEEFLDLDTLLTYIDDEELEEVLDEVDEEELVTTLLKHKKARLDAIHKQLVKDNQPEEEKSAPGFMDHYKEAYQAHLKQLKKSQKLPYLFDEPSTQWIYNKEKHEIYYASGSHADPVQLKLLQGYPMGDPTDVRGKLLDQLGDCSACHTHESIMKPHIDKVWQSHHRKTLFKFKHLPHTQNMSIDCTHCHVQEGQGAVTKSGFYPIKKDQCTSCHQSTLAGEDCLQCHNYHADQMSSDKHDANAMIKFLGLD